MHEELAEIAIKLSVGSILPGNSFLLYNIKFR